jgi:uncharacterized LabA/DUF88 family protein
MIAIPSEVEPHARRWMLFVDGENLTIRAQMLARNRGFSLTEGPNYMPDVFVWMPDLQATKALIRHATNVQRLAIRAYYYTSLVGDDNKINIVRQSIWELGFTPEVFKKDKRDQKSKGVDITLARDMLGHAFMGNFDVAVLIAGDGDYVPLVRELKRLGKGVDVMFFSGAGLGLSSELRLNSDTFHGLDEYFEKRWRGIKDE